MTPAPFEIVARPKPKSGHRSEYWDSIFNALVKLKDNDAISIIRSQVPLISASATPGAHWSYFYSHIQRRLLIRDYYAKHPNLKIRHAWNEDNTSFTVWIDGWV